MEFHHNLFKKSKKYIFRKITTGCIMAGLIVMSFSGCSGSTDKKDEKTEASSSTEAESLTESSEKQTPDSSVLSDKDVGVTIDSDGVTILDDYVRVLDDGVNIRMKPSTEADIDVVLAKGVDLHRTGEKDGWSRVKMNGSSFYVSSNFVEKTDIEWKQNEKQNEKAHIVYIDPAKQITADSEKEQIGPDSTVTKARMSPANIGVNTGNFEYDITLTLARKLKAILETRGYTVVMSRDSSSITMSNRERAILANTSSAEVYIKLQAGSASPDVKGIMGFVITQDNPYNSDDYNKSYDLCDSLIGAAVKETGAKKKGIVKTDKLTVLNYCNMPSTVINVGFLSNSEDDTNLSNDEYMEKMAEGIANGIDEYFGHDSSMRQDADSDSNSQDASSDDSQNSGDDDSQNSDGDGNSLDTSSDSDSQNVSGDDDSQNADDNSDSQNVSGDDEAQDSSDDGDSQYSGSDEGDMTDAQDEQ